MGKGGISLFENSAPKKVSRLLMFKMPVQAESLKIVLVGGLVTVWTGIFWSFYPLLAHEASLPAKNIYVLHTLLWKDGEKYETETPGFLKTQKLHSF